MQVVHGHIRRDYKNLPKCKITQDKVYINQMSESNTKYVYIK